jgi:hypothetical protein
MTTLITLLSVILLLFFSSLDDVQAFSAGKGFGGGSSSSSSPSNKSFIGADRFKAICPAASETIKKFDSTLIFNEDDGSSISDKDIWVAVYRSKNNLPSVFVRDSFFDAMAVATTVQDGDSQTLVSVQEGTGVISSGNLQHEKPVAVARLTASQDDANVSIIDSMRCTLKKEDTNNDCDGGSEHCEAIGVCIDELVLSYLQSYLETESKTARSEQTLHFDGGIRFRGTLFSGKLLDSRGFREATQLSSDMHSHESDFDGALTKYAERSTSTDVSKSPGTRDRSLKIISLLSKIDRNEDQKKDIEEGEDEEDSDYDPWASVKRFY